MKPVLSLVASGLLLLLVSYASGDTRPAPAADPVWSCGDAPQETWQEVNKCRAECAATRDARRAACETSYNACKDACPSGEDRMACLKPCRDTYRDCLAPLDADASRCADDCVTSHGCTL